MAEFSQVIRVENGTTNLLSLIINEKVKASALCAGGRNLNSDKD